MLAPGARLEPVPTIDETRHLELAELCRRHQEIAPPPRECGRVRLICSRLPEDRRWLPERVELSQESGLRDDRWYRNQSDGHERYGHRYRDMQLATMQFGVAQLIANGQPLWLFGDNLFLDLDLSRENLPVGSELAIGEARLVVTAEPHDGCKKFRARFGDAALRFVARRETRAQNLRGIYLRVTSSAEIQLDEVVQVLHRPAIEQPAPAIPAT